MKKFLSIKTRLIFMLSASAFAALVISSATTFYYSMNKQKEHAYVSLSQITELMGNNLKASLEFGDDRTAANILATLHFDSDVLSAFIFTPDKQMFASYVMDKERGVDLAEHVLAVFQSHGTEEKATVAGDDYIITTFPIVSEGDELGSLAVIYGTETMQESVFDLLTTYLFTTLVTIGIVLVLSLKLHHLFTRPIFKLKELMDLVTAKKQYDVDTHIDQNDEFKILFNRLGVMLGTIKTQNQKISKQKEFVTKILDSQEQIVVTTDGEKIFSANRMFLNFFGIESLKQFQYPCIGDLFHADVPEGYLHKIMPDGAHWTRYVLEHPEKKHYAIIEKEGTPHIFSVHIAEVESDDRGLMSAVFNDITELENAKREMEFIHQQTQDSINYASLIQHALLPEPSKLRNFFGEYFALWHPKDVVGGDILLFEQISEDEGLLMVIDCTGHGVPGAFVTILVKAIERQLVANLHRDGHISPAELLTLFNRSIRHFLKQERKEAASNAGFDGGILYYNRKKSLVRYAGANTPLFYLEEGKVKIFKGDRHSIGYKTSDPNYAFSDFEITFPDVWQFYITTDGYLDQNGGDKGFPFGKKRFKSILAQYGEESIADQQEVLLNTLHAYQGDEERNDDVTVFGARIRKSEAEA